MPVRRDGLSFDSEEGAAEEQMAGKDTVGAGGRCWGGGRGALSTRLGSWKQQRWWRKGSSRGWRRLWRQSDPFIVAHAAVELTMGVAGDEEKGNKYFAAGRNETLCFYREIEIRQKRSQRQKRSRLISERSWQNLPRGCC
ncbi:hypothetical protein BHE74_00025200 [Ensete ventricosum]|nr:hypothetical protein BHE74_00025200 [Ensete ventricosum]RZR88414.1 hypothetical protein BHM03_00016003 [Ensete ventricosum]